MVCFQRHRLRLAGRREGLAGDARARRKVLDESKDEHRPGYATGPRTIQGKERSSRNATKHGCRTKRPLLGDESQAEYDALRAGWLEEYDPATFASVSLVEKVALEDWLLKRAERRVVEAEERLEADGDAMQASEEQHKQLQLMQRYKTTAERAFYRAWRAVEQLRSSRMREALAMERMRERTAEKAAKNHQRVLRERQEAEEKVARQQAEEERRVRKEQQELARAARSEQAEAEKAAKKVKSEEAAPQTRASVLFQGQNSKKKQKKIYTLEQWVEVRVEDGQTVTRLYPSNEQLIEDGKKMWPAPDLVYRRFHFPHGIPEEYRWTAPAEDAGRMETGGAGIQRMTPDTWLETIEREAQRGDGHVGPTGVGNLPRPKERGGCECDVCARNREMLEKKMMRQ